MTTTATDTLQRKSTDANVISGGHLVARALKNEGVDTIFTLCGGHIIDIYDGCLDEGIRIIDVRHEQVAAHAADGYARQTGRLGCVVTTAGPGCTNAMTGIACAFRAETPILHIGGQGALTQHKMGSLQDLPHVDMMAPITKFAATVPSTERVADMVSMAARECYNGAWGPSYLEIPRDVLDREVELSKAVIPAPGALPRLDPLDRRSRRYREARRSAGERRAALHPARHPGLELPRPQGGDRAGPPAQHPGLLQRLGPRPAAARRSASLQPHPAPRVRQGRRHRDRRHAVRLPHGLRPAARQGRRRGADRSGLSDGRQEPRHLARAGRPPGRDPGRGRPGGIGPRRQPGEEPARLDGGAPGRGAEGDRQADAAVHAPTARRSTPTGSRGRSTSS